MLTAKLVEKKWVEMAKCMTFAPTDPIVVKRAQDTMLRMIGDQNIPSAGVMYTPEMRLDWLVTTMIEDVSKWPEAGLKELRAVYGCRFKPADGKEVYSMLPGFHPEDMREIHTMAPGLLAGVPPPKQITAGPGDEPMGDLIGERLRMAVKRIAPKG